VLNKMTLKDIEGFEVSKNIFRGFTVEETLMQYDFPILLVANSPKKQKWLFKWCESIDHSGVSIWIAFWISENRLYALKNNKMSLREAVMLPEKKFYIFEAKNLFEPTIVIESFPEKLPIDFIPSDDISVNGTLLRQGVQNGERLTVRFHVFSDNFWERMAPLSIISPLQNRFQEYMTWTAHAIERTPKGRVPSSFEDWSGFDLTSVTRGSFRMECVSNSRNKQTEVLAKACEILANLSNGTLEIKSILEELGEEFGSEVIHYISLLSKFVSKFDLSMSISWASQINPNGFLAFDKRRGDKILSNLDEIHKREFLRKITITLTPMEAEPIRKPIRGQGGMQGLLRNLQSKLKPDNTIELSPEEIEKILRYGLNYGQGGFQDRLVGIAKVLQRVGISFYTG
jgi:hypothetical protein